MSAYIPAGLLVIALREAASQIEGQTQGTTDPWMMEIDPAIIDWLTSNLTANTVMSNYVAAQLQTPHDQTAQAGDGQLSISIGSVVEQEEALTPSLSQAGEGVQAPQTDQEATTP